LYSSNQTRSSKSTLRSDWPDAIRCPDFFVLRHCSPNYQEVTIPETINLRVALTSVRVRDRGGAIARSPRGDRSPKQKCVNEPKRYSKQGSKLSACTPSCPAVALCEGGSLARRRVRRWTACPSVALREGGFGVFFSVQTKAPRRHFCSHRPVGSLKDAWLTAHRAVATAENRSAQPDFVAGIGDAGGRSTQRSRDHRSRLQYKQKRPAEAGRFELIKPS